MKPKDIHIGDILRVRQWEDMEAEFGRSEFSLGSTVFSHIRTKIPFVPKMRHLCGTIVAVSDISQSSDFITSCVWPEGEGSNQWVLSADMLEPAESPEDTTSYDPISTEELAKFLNS